MRTLGEVSQYVKYKIFQHSPLSCTILYEILNKYAGGKLVRKEVGRKIRSKAKKPLEYP